MGLPLRTARTLQLVTVAMLFTSLAQLVYWLWDEAAYMSAVQRDRLAQLEREVAAGQALLDGGSDQERVRAWFPSLEVEAGRVALSPVLVAELDEARRGRLFRYGSEGTFLLLVIAGGIAALTHAIKQPAELLRRQENFVAAVSHELKSPLASIRLAAETLQLRAVDREKQEQLAERVVRDTARLEAMVSNILDAGRLREGRLDLRPEPMHLATVVRTRAEKAGELADSESPPIRVEVGAELVVRVDRTALVTVLDNLLSNALKSVRAARGGEVVVTAWAEGDEVLLEVRDQGVGFAPEEAERLFERFYRPGDELRRRTEGSGLGLHIVRSLVEASGGTVVAESPGEGRGATFRVRLPRLEEVPA
jgi:signal transduction histidine kinase